MMEVIQTVAAVLSTLIALAALFFAYYIPRKIMVSQIFADLIADYRKPEMGIAVLALFDFYKND
jgi:hypothetical protein